MPYCIENGSEVAWNVKLQIIWGGQNAGPVSKEEADRGVMVLGRIHLLSVASPLIPDLHSLDNSISGEKCKSTYRLL